MTPETALYCNMQAMSSEERKRYNQLRERLEGAIEEINELDAGYGFRLQIGALSVIELAEWVEYERKCCPFFDLGIEVERENGPLALRIGGRKGVKEFILTEFKMPKMH